MKKFTDITDKDSSMEFNKDKESDLSNDITELNDQVSDEVKNTILN